MSLYCLAKYNTSPDMIHFACKNGIKENPLYMKCDDCPNQNFCNIYFSFTPPPELSPHDLKVIQESLNAIKKPKPTPAEKWREIFIGVTIWAVICLIGWLTS